MAKSNEVHLLGVFVHGALSALHALGLVYNLRRKNTLDVAMHGAALIYSLHATTHHCRECRPEKEIA